MSRVRTGFLIEFSALKDVIGRSRDAEAGKVWLRVKKFIEKGGYSKVRYDGEFASLVMSGYDDSFIGHKFGIALETVRGHRKRVGDALERLLGEDFCQLFYHFKENKDEINNRIKGFELMNIESCDLFPKEVFAYVPDRSETPRFDLKDCIDEIEFLKEYCIPSIDSKKSVLDVNKLDFLMGVIDGDCGTPIIKTELLSYILPKEEV